ncbi:MAG: alpha-E domain-containing protein, partial [Opitutaceae bacterium]|nr:alpha-E domain-containing protein [Opitutaceae bacterium]
LEACRPKPPSLGFKDIWVLESEEDSYIVGPPPMEPPDFGPFLAAAHLPSRLADNLFWLGRSVERLEAACRLLMLALPRLESGTSLPRDIAERTLLIHCLARAGLVSADIAGGTASGRLLRETMARDRLIGRLV